jgi:hypothetical protein
MVLSSQTLAPDLVAGVVTMLCEAELPSPRAAARLLPCWAISLSFLQPKLPSTACASCGSGVADVSATIEPWQWQFLPSESQQP